MRPQPCQNRLHLRAQRAKGGDVAITDQRGPLRVDMAMEVGFKSKSSFNDAFKKVTPITPTQFKRELETSP